MNGIRSASLQTEIALQVTYSALNGMKFRQYDVTTPDGWILQVWRLQSPEIFDEKLSAPIILLPSLGGQPLHYMRNARNESIAFILADNGYDVFLLNYRGNQYSNKKIKDGEPTDPVSSDYYQCRSMKLSLFYSHKHWSKTFSSHSCLIN